ncbi:MAG: hypothetical protein EHM72_11620 [Calditrichaeota bacterium]|nr:MAG: hypothetical protein EHM72_11620 [Calditrichota bacterium]
MLFKSVFIGMVFQAALIAHAKEPIQLFNDTQASVDTLRVNYTRVINRTDRRQIGINTCFFTDDDHTYFRKPSRPYHEAIKELGVRYLRYPGGWKSDVLFWSKPPYSHADPSLILRGSKYWPFNDSLLVNDDGTWRIDPYDFDDFIETCRRTGAEPVIVVAYNALRWPIRTDTRKPSKQEIIENAAEWVRYTNVRKQYGIKFWEIGNETWLNFEDETGMFAAIDPDVYGFDVADIAAAMKAVDSTIWVGVNGHSEYYFSQVFEEAAPYIDFLSVHTYPLYGWKSYQDYLDQNPDATAIVKTAARSLSGSSELANQDIKIMVTEFASGTFAEWDREGSNLGRALITFDLQGQLLQDSLCYFSQFWNTINVYEQGNSVFNALANDNSLTAVGQSLALWGQYLEDEMLQTGSTKMVKCYATKTDGGNLTIFILNKDLQPHRLLLNIANLPSGTMKHGEEWRFTGNSLLDPAPALKWIGKRKLGKKIEMNIPSISITLLRFH